ncbi:MAG TPA: glycoside hydrolase family 13 protein [Clostridiales bacterium]|nr:glycoside hydrolase family 13 protein [Clostridiales bacterium]
MPFEYGAVEVQFCLFDENTREIGRFEMLWQDCEDGIEIWACSHVFKKTGLYFYRFMSGDAVIKPDGRDYWQQTVYDQNMKTPEGFAGGVIYQIFPDRFFQAKELKNPYPDRHIVTDKAKLPEYANLERNFAVQNNDYYGGDLAGIIAKLDYLASLGVTILYLNPIFEAHSNHRYNTADYLKIDPMLGDEQEFIELAQQAKKRGIKIILDGVFSHTGSDSRYFDATRYGEKGAANDQTSPYFSWYCFRHWPNDYDCWWNVRSLPNTVEVDPGFSEFITGENGVIRKWLRLGASGWRLDVADELPEEFIRKIHTACKAENPEAIVIGEVWENASNKISYGHRRHYLLGGELDSVMDYPIADAVIAYIRDGNYKRLSGILNDLQNDYPPQTLSLLMNHLGTHDTARLITRLAGEPQDGHDRAWQAKTFLSLDEYTNGIKQVKLASALNYMLFGIPTIYYGDEIGMQGYGDPFNRGYFDWEHPNSELTAHFTALGKLRKDHPMLADAALEIAKADEHVFAFTRKKSNEIMLCAVNRSNKNVLLKAEKADLLYGNGVYDSGALEIPEHNFFIGKISC